MSTKVIDIQKTESHVTFTFDIPIHKNTQPTGTKDKHIFSKLKLYNEGCSTIIYDSHTEEKIMEPYCSNGLLNTIFHAYNEHIPIKFRPDDIWLSILISCGKYICANYNSFKTKIVNHDGIIDLILKLDDDPKDNPNLWLDITNKLLDKIKEHTKSDITEWYLPNFSTTTDKDRFISNFVFMSTLKKSFNYGGCCDCGLPQVTLEGTRDDWINLIEKVKWMYNFNDNIINNWCKLLRPVLDNFVSAYDNIIDPSFWQRICTYITRGSAGETYFKGWFLVFSPFSKNMEYMLNDFDKVQETNIYANVEDDKICDATMDVNFDLDYFGTKYKYTLFGGMTGTQYNESTNVLYPCCDYIIIKTREATTEDIKNIFYKNIPTYGFNKLFNEKGGHEMILNFGYFLIKKLDLPNNVHVLLSKTIAESTQMSTRCKTFNKKEILKNTYISVFNNATTQEFIKHNFDTTFAIIDEFIETDEGKVEL